MCSSMLIRTGRAAVVLALLAGTPAIAAPPPATEMTEADRARWTELLETYFPGRAAEPAGDMLRLEAPYRAADAALVPIAIHVAPQQGDPVRRLHLLVDDNPVPLVFTAEIGERGLPHMLETRVRVDQYTHVHALAETESGRLLETSAFVKASGGCSAPALKDPEQALARMGRMKLNLPADIRAGQPVEAQALISHPNNSGLQFDQITRTYIQPHYIERVSIRYNGAPVLDVKTDISMSEDPSLHFRFVPDAEGMLEVEAVDSKGATFRQSWPVGAPPA